MFQISLPLLRFSERPKSDSYASITFNTTTHNANRMHTENNSGLRRLNCLNIYWSDFYWTERPFVCRFLTSHFKAERVRDILKNALSNRCFSSMFRCFCVGFRDINWIRLEEKNMTGTSEGASVLLIYLMQQIIHYIIDLMPLLRVSYWPNNGNKLPSYWCLSQ